MAPIHTTVDIEHQLTIHTVTGEATAGEIILVIQTQNEALATKYILWDFSKASVHHLEASDVHDIVAVQQRYSHRRQGGKTAILVASDLVHGMSRMYDSYQQINNTEIVRKILRDKEQALQWLLEENP
jgi:hypothetical protein